MTKKLIISLILLTLIITACGGQPTQIPLKPTSPTRAVTQPTPNAAAGVSVADVSFAKDVMPILENNCNKCHGGEQMKAGLDMRTYESLMAGSFKGPDIVAGNSANSFLIQQVVNGKMPKRGPKLTPAQIKTLSDWIDAGALSD